MKKILILVLGVLLCVSFKSSGAQTAQARLFCLSVRFQQASSPDGQFTLDLTTTDPAVAINGELAPTFDTPSHSSIFHEYDTLFDEFIDGFITFDAPLSADANNNGFADFYETSQSVSGTTDGTYDASPVDRGTVKAIWNRAAGSKDGTCTIRMRSAMFGQLPDFVHTFELIEYTGPLNYTPGTNKVSGALNLTQTGDDTSKLAGPIEFTKSATNRFNQLSLLHGVWTNAASETFKISNDSDFFLRDEVLKTNYFGYVDFEDGLPGTADPDYLTWILSIDDANDSDLDGIPDFTDDPGSGAVRQPTVLLGLDGANVSFSISSIVGRTVEIEEISSLSLTNWTSIRSFAPTNDPQVVSLPRPTEGTKFWRVRVP